LNIEIFGEDVVTDDYGSNCGGYMQLEKDMG